MVYLYSNPIVQEIRGGELEPVAVPLEVNQEYIDLVESLKRAGKQFQIKKEAINSDTLGDMIDKKPSIIHISSHGAFDRQKEEFYLAVENKKDKIGIEYKLYEDNLKHILNVRGECQDGKQGKFS